MSDPITVDCVIEPFWHVIDRIRERVERSLSAYGGELAGAGAMIASELLENAVKYGHPGPDGPAVGFRMEADDHRIRIHVTNRLRSPEDADRLRDHIDRIMNALDPAALYIERLEYLMDHPGADRALLGLCRMVYEGAFSLNLTRKDDDITITAVRDIHPNIPNIAMED